MRATGSGSTVEFPSNRLRVFATNKNLRPELLSAPVDQFLVQPVQTSALGFDLLKVPFHLFPPFSLMKARISVSRPEGGPRTSPFIDADFESLEGRAYLRLEVRLLRSGQHVGGRNIQVEKNLAERGPVPRLAVPADLREEREVCSTPMPVKINTPPPPTPTH